MQTVLSARGGGEKKEKKKQQNALSRQVLKLSKL